MCTLAEVVVSDACFAAQEPMDRGCFDPPIASRDPTNLRRSRAGPELSPRQV
jgi:hypothetical protein